MKRLLATATLITFFISIIPNSYAAITPGSKCAKVGTTSTFAGKKYTCIKSGKKLVWNKGVKIAKPTPAPTPAPTPVPTTILKGSFKNPYNLGDTFKVNDFTLTITSIESDVTTLVCAAIKDIYRPELCTLTRDSNYEWVAAVDPTKSDRYVRWQIAARNDSNDIHSLSSAINVRMTDSKGALLSSGFHYILYPNLINWDNELIPGGTINSYVYFQQAKSANLAPLLLVIQSSNYFDSSTTIYVANR